MKDFTFKKIVFRFSAITGIVVGNNKYSETRVSSSGGGGYVTQHGGVVHAPKISSVAITNHEFWLKTNDGKEVPIKLVGHDIPMNTGQKITVISAFDKSGKTGFHTTVINHSANRHWDIKSAESLLSYFYMSTSAFWVLLKTIFLAMAITLSSYGIFNELLPEKTYYGRINYKTVTLEQKQEHLRKIMERDASRALRNKYLVEDAPFYLAAVYFLYASISYFSRVSKLIKALEEHMESNTLEAYSY